MTINLYDLCVNYGNVVKSLSMATRLLCRKSLTNGSGSFMGWFAPSRMNMINYYYYIHIVYYVWYSYVNTYPYRHHTLPIERITHTPIAIHMFPSLSIAHAASV